MSSSSSPLSCHRPQFSTCHTRGATSRRRSRATSPVSLALADGPPSPLLPCPHLAHQQPAQRLALLPLHPVADLPGRPGLSVLGLLGRTWRRAAAASVLPPACLSSARSGSQVSHLLRIFYHSILSMVFSGWQTFKGLCWSLVPRQLLTVKMERERRR